MNLIKHLSTGLAMSLSSAAKLRSLLKSMEQDLHLSDLTEVQRDMYYACRLIAEESGEVTLSSLQAHELTAGVPRATYFRALAGLVELGRLVRVGSLSPVGLTFRPVPLAGRKQRACSPVP